ncbi:MAG: hypothetical protein RR494_13635 [Vagococcus sp.]|uniref:hypothetical protein n=1 Tax=Vagococcus sp. TaxID=1933889 RepID=UPI002FC681EC
MNKTDKELAVELTIALLEHNAKFVNSQGSKTPNPLKSDELIKMYKNIFDSLNSK